MRYINSRFTYLLTYLLTYLPVRVSSNSVELARPVLPNHLVFTVFFHAVPQMNPFAT